MSTRAMIGVQEKDGRITGVYHHSDSYPAYLGNLLLKHYNNEESARAIVALGDLSILMQRLAPHKGEKHSFNERAKDVTVAYHRDRGEPFCCAKEDTLSGFLQDASDAWASYVYLYDCAAKQWLYRTLSDKTGKILFQLSIKNED